MEPLRVDPEELEDPPLDRVGLGQPAQHEVMRASGLPILANRIEVACLLRDGAPGSDGEESGQPEAGPPMRLVLVATGDDRLRSAARGHLAEHGFAVATAADGVECVAVVRERNPDVDVVVLDGDLLWGGADGVVAYLRASSTKLIPVVLLASRPSSSHMCTSSFDAPIVSVLGRPVTPEVLLRAVRCAAGERRDRA